MYMPTLSSQSFYNFVKVVQILRPGVEADLERDIQAQIKQLQKQLQEAHAEVHDTEDRLDQAIQYYTNILDGACFIENNLESEGNQIVPVECQGEPTGQQIQQLKDELLLQKTTQAEIEIQLSLVQLHAEQKYMLQETIPQIDKDIQLNQQVQTMQNQSNQQEIISQQQRQQQQAQPSTKKSQRKVIYNSLQISEKLRNYWYPVYFQNKWEKSHNFHQIYSQFTLFSTDYVLFKHQQSKELYCLEKDFMYRDLKIDPQSQRLDYLVYKYSQLPGQFLQKDLKEYLLPVQIKDGLIWIWMGERNDTSLEDKIKKIPNSGNVPKPFTIHSEIEMEVDVEHGLMVENLLDLAHAPFTHTQTFAQGWPIPDFVKFQTWRVMGGHWDPYPIEQSFDIPCIVQSTIGLVQAGKIVHGAKIVDAKNHLQQMHICLPVNETKCRVLYRMSMDFLDWTRFVPGIDFLWQNIAAKVMGEDTPLVKGQQYRMQKGGDVWANPVSYDKIALRYRKWRNSVGTNNSLERKALEEQLKVKISSGEMFSIEDNEQ